MRIKTILRLSGTFLLAGALSACGDNNNMPGTSPTPTPTASPTPTPTQSPTGFQGMFGTAFAAIFNAPTTSEPVDPSDSSVPALAPASQPLDN